MQIHLVSGKKSLRIVLERSNKSPDSLTFILSQTNKLSAVCFNPSCSIWLAMENFSTSLFLHMIAMMEHHRPVQCFTYLSNSPRCLLSVGLFYLNNPMQQVGSAQTNGKSVHYSLPWSIRLFVCLYTHHSI